MNAITVELDEPTATSLTHLCSRWGVPPLEAVRRAVKEADATPKQSTPEERLVAFRELQRLMQMTPEKADGWKAAIRDGRR
ncbi:MAG: hypothetical protein RL514_1471 [Verrucomicrobiota bacterium]|jgi:hypothetical protein